MKRGEYWLVVYHQIGFIRLDLMIRLCTEHGRLILIPGLLRPEPSYYPGFVPAEVRGGGINPLCTDGCINRRYLVAGCNGMRLIVCMRRIESDKNLVRGVPGFRIYGCSMGIGEDIRVPAGGPVQFTVVVGEGRIVRVTTP